jgi:hypothetical protein
MKRSQVATWCLILVAINLIAFSCVKPPPQPLIRCEPAAVDTGKQVIVKGSGFAPREEVFLIADTVLPMRGAVAVVMSLAMADDKGEFDEVIVIPPPMAPGIPPKFAPGNYTVRAMGNRLVAVGNFTVR